LGRLALNQVDAASLHAAVDRYHQMQFLVDAPREPYVAWLGTEAYPATPIWSEVTYAQSPEERTRLVTQATTAAEQAGLLSAGYLATEARGAALWCVNGAVLYAPQTLAQC